MSRKHKQIEMSERAARVLSLYKLGLTMRAISQREHISIKTVHLDINKYLDEVKRNAEEEAGRIHAKNLSMLNDALHVAYQNIMNNQNDLTLRLSSIDRLTKVVDSISKIVTPSGDQQGLKIELNNINIDDIRERIYGPDIIKKHAIVDIGDDN